jgi:predicted Zn-dependent peptidase
MQRLGSDILAHNRLIPDLEILQKISAVKKADVTRVAEKIFTSSKPTFAAIGKVGKVTEFEKIRKNLA